MAAPLDASLLERAQELAALDGAIAAAQNAGGRFLVIEGPPGIGKTSLLANGRARATAAGFLVLQARGSELESGFSFGIVRQLFEPVLAQAKPDHKATLLHGAAAHAGRLFGAEAEMAQPDEDVAFSLLHGLYWLTLNLSERRPLVIAIDDLQWADTPSLRWLIYLARRIEGQGVCVIATIRPGSEESPLLSELLVDPGIAVLQPSALSLNSVTALVRAELGADADEAFCLACHRATGGNPLLLRELMRTLAAGDVPPIATSATVVERAAPDAVARSVRLRLSRLPSEAGRLARAVAILGDGVDRERAAALTDLEHRQIAPAAAVLARVDLLRQRPPFAFIHPVVRNAVYESIRAEERESEHARAAEIVKTAKAPPAHIAAHILLAPPGSVDGAVAILRDAAREAVSEGGLEGASSYLRRALDEPIGDEERAALFVELGAIELNLGSTSTVEYFREAIMLTDDPKRRAQAQLHLGRALYRAGRDEEGVRVVKEALNEWTHADDLRRRLEATLVANATRLARRLEEARRLLDSLELDVGEGQGARMLLCLRAYHEAARGGNRERAAAEAQQAFGAMSDDEQRSAYVAACYTLLVSDHLDETVHLLDTLIAHARKVGAVFNFAGLSIMRATFHYARGALPEAESDARTALQVVPDRQVSWGTWAYGWLAQILVERGAVHEAAATVNAGEGETPSGADSFSRLPLLRARAVVAVARGDHQTALADAVALGETLAAYGHSNPAFSYPSWRSLAAQAQFGLGQTDEALRLIREDVTRARAWGAPRTLGRALRMLGVLEGAETGLERLREAVGLLEHSPARLEHAYALADLGGALRRANRRTDAREPLRRALEMAHQCGATRLAERAHDELVAAGARPRRRVFTGVDALTPSERRIAAMAADGLSNREIAQALFVTLRTVEMHLSQAFRKLDISTRTQLPGALATSPQTPGRVSAG